MSGLKPGDDFRGFRVHSRVTLNEYRGEGIFLEHRETGCRLFHLLREDPENLFAFIFETPSSDNSGVAHILEHSVLSGSQRFPLKDPFLSLMKGSMNTFLNAMTYPDKTVYPAASTLEKDYFNLMDVYGDSVFFPLLKEEVFMQEGHRLEMNAGEPSIAGIVYNEMQGAYSSHETIVNEWSYRYLFPDTSYRFDSGGEPPAIPHLTYEEFKAYHRKYYHPSNCRIFLYGNIPTEKQLIFLEDKFLNSFPPAEETREGRRESVSPASWDTPRTFFMTSSLEEGEETNKATITMNWKTLTVTDSSRLLALEILAEMLLGNVGCPLYKAVMESGLGEDVAPASGLDTEIRDAVFTLGIRGCEASRREDFEALVMATLKDLVREGIPGELILGSLHQVEFRNREIRGGVPFGLRLMDRSLRGWLHGTTPWETMGVSDALEKLKASIRGDSRFFEKLIQELFLDNPHRTTLVVTPDPAHDRRLEKERGVFLKNKIEGMDAAGVKALEDKNRRFSEYQNLPDTPRDRAKIPVLHRDDLPRDISLVDTVLYRVEGIPFYFHDLYTNGIVYIDFAFDVRGLEKESSCFLPLLSRILCTTGVPGLTYDQVALKLSLLTGGLYTFLEASPVINIPGESREYLFFRLKVLEKDMVSAMDLVENLLLHGDITNESRIRDLLLEQRNDFKSSLLPMGQSIAALRGAAKLSSILTREEAWRGIDQYFFLNRKAADLDRPGGAAAVGQILLELRKRVFRRDNLLVNITGASSILEAAKNRVSAFALGLSSGSPETQDPDFLKASWNYPPGAEALIFPSAVGFTARILPGAMAGTEMHSRELLLGHFLKTTWLWEEIRMKGGAYGASSSANGAEGLFSFTSYRDPAPENTFRVYRESLRRAAETPMPADELEKTVISVVGKDAKPMSPGERSMMGFRRDLYGVTDEIRRKNRETILRTTPEEVSEASGALLETWEKGVSVFLSGDEMAKRVESLPGGDTFTRINLPG